MTRPNFPNFEKKSQLLERVFLVRDLIHKYHLCLFVTRAWQEIFFFRNFQKYFFISGKKEIEIYFLGSGQERKK